MAGAAGSIPIQGTKIPYTMHLGGEKKKGKSKRKKRGWDLRNKDNASAM